MNRKNESEVSTVVIKDIDRQFNSGRFGFRVTGWLLSIMKCTSEHTFL